MLPLDRKSIVDVHPHINSFVNNKRGKASGKLLTTFRDPDALLLREHTYENETKETDGIKR